MRPRGALLIATIVGLAGLGALGLSLGDRIELPSRITVPDLLPVIMPLALVLAVAVVVLRLRMRSPGQSEPRPKSSWLARIVLGLLVAAAVVAILSTRRDDRREAAAPPERGRAPGEDGTPEVAGGGSGWALVILAACTILGILAVIVVARTTRPRPDPAGSADDDELLRAVAAGREALRSIDANASPRNAVIAAYAAMESSLAAQGIGRVRTDAPADLLARATAVLEPTASAAARDLTTLFELARFSSDELPADAVESARTAFSTIETALRTASASAP